MGKWIFILSLFSLLFSLFVLWLQTSLKFVVFSLLCIFSVGGAYSCIKVLLKLYRRDELSYGKFKENIKYEPPFFMVEAIIDDIYYFLRDVKR